MGVGIGPEFQPPGPPHGLDALPVTAADQDCALCGSDRVEWLHPLDMRQVRYRVYGKEHTLPHFWTLCGSCERLHEAGDVEGLLAVMTGNRDAYQWRDAADVEELVRTPLVVFRRADLGARRISGRGGRS